MVVVVRILTGLLLIAHGLVHLLYLVDDVPEFDRNDSWLVPVSATRPVANVLLVATIVTSVLLGLAVWGMPGLVGIWPALAIVAAGTSLVLLVLFWNWRLMIGVAIDLAVIAVALVQPAWTNRFLG